MRLSLGMHDGKIFRADMPDRVLIQVKDSQTRSKDSAGSQSKKATLVNGHVIVVPGHVGQGDMVWVRPTTDEFVRKEN